MKRILTLVLLLASVICAASGALAEPVMLQYKFTKGEVEKYNVSITGSFSGDNLPQGMPTGFGMTVSIQQRTLEVYGDGSAKIRQFIGEPKVTQGIMPKGNKPTSMTLVKTVARDGRVLSITSDMGAISNGGLGIGQSPGELPLLPTQAVEVGKGWMQTIPIPGINTQLMLNSKLLSAGSPSDPQSQSEIEQTYNTRLDLSQFIQQMVGSMSRSKGGAAVNGKEVSGMSIDLSGSSRISFSPALGKLMKLDGSMSGTMRMALTGNQTGSGTFNISANFSQVKTQ